MISTRQQKRKKLIQAFAEIYGVDWLGFAGCGALLLELEPSRAEDEDELGRASLDEEEGLAAEEELALGSLEEEEEEAAARGSDGMSVNGRVERVLRIPRKVRRRITMESGWRKRFWLDGGVRGMGCWV
jgi:hypothetical protein